MSRDRFVKTEWGDWKGINHRNFGYCDHGFILQTREEAEVYQELKAQGYKVHKHGWPDFMATRGTEIRLIEVKGSHDKVRTSQERVHLALMQLGVKVEVILRSNPNKERKSR